jgi:hypothetical protein
MSGRRSLALVPALSALLLVAGCRSQGMPEATFITDRAELRRSTERDRTLVAAPPADVDRAAYTRVIVEPVEVLARGVDAEAAGQVAAALRDALAENFGRSRQLVDGPGPGTLRVRVAVTDITPVSPGEIALNVVGTVLLGPVANGGAAVEGEVTDAMTGRRIAALVVADERRFSALSGYYSRTGHARSVVEAFAAELAGLVPPGAARALAASP